MYPTSLADLLPHAGSVADSIVISGERITFYSPDEDLLWSKSKGKK
jgi:hypothetical protein